jgi:Domain of unknown function (DUF397)
MSALDLSGARWRKSSSNVANCVEVAITTGTVAVLDSKNPADGVLAVPPHAWTAFTAALRQYEFG